VLRGNLEHLDEAAEWVPVIHCLIEPPEVVPDDKSLLVDAVRIADSIDWSTDPWHALTDALKASTGRKGRALFHPLRKALTGRDSGPEMAPLLKLIGKERALERLAAAAG
jgi:glutamyl-tRNA synthetase